MSKKCILTFFIVSFQILTLRLLRSVLPAWTNPQDQTKTLELVIMKLFILLGCIVVSCASDPTLALDGKC